MYQNENNIVATQAHSFNPETVVEDLKAGRITPAQIETGVTFDGTREGSDGNKYPVMSLIGATGNPDFSEFVPAHENRDGRLVKDRFTLYVLTRPDEADVEAERRYTSYRVSWWGKEARTAYEAYIRRGPNTGLIKIDQAGVSHYRDPVTPGLTRFSLNINFGGQWTPLTLANAAIDEDKIEAAFSVMGAAARANRASQTRQAEQAQPTQPTQSAVTADDLFPGVGDEDAPF